MADVIVTMGCGDTCPVYPGKRYLDWDLDDPAGEVGRRGPANRGRDRPSGPGALGRTHPDCHLVPARPQSMTAADPAVRSPVVVLRLHD